MLPLRMRLLMLTLASRVADSKWQHLEGRAAIECFELQQPWTILQRSIMSGELGSQDM